MDLFATAAFLTGDHHAFEQLTILPSQIWLKTPATSLKR